MNFSSNKKSIRINASYADSPNHSSDSVDINIDEDHALMVIPKKEATVSLRKEGTDEWVDVVIPEKTFHKLNVSRYDMLNVVLNEAGSDARVTFRSLGRSYSDLDKQSESTMDEIEAYYRKFEWLPKITVVAV